MLNKKYLLLIQKIVCLALLIFLIDGINFDFLGTKSDTEKVRIALNNTDDKILNIIDNITIVDSFEEIRKACNKIEVNNTVGCVYITSRDEIENASIYVVSSKAYGMFSCSTFQNTIYHEIGHIDFAMKFGNIDNTSIKEYYADHYASNFSKPNCLINSVGII